MRLTRRDGDQDLTRFSATLPPGVVAKLAGVSECSDAAIAAAKTKTGLQELAAPSCPAELGDRPRRSPEPESAPVLTYVPGQALPRRSLPGRPALASSAIVPAVAGPFDVGTVVTREALQLEPPHWRGHRRRRALRPDPPHPRRHPARR